MLSPGITCPLGLIVSLFAKPQMLGEVSLPSSSTVSTLPLPATTRDPEGVKASPASAPSRRNAMASVPDVFNFATKLSPKQYGLAGLQLSCPATTGVPS